MQTLENAVYAVMGLRQTDGLHLMGKIIPSQPRACAINNTTWVNNSGTAACNCVWAPQKLFGNVLG